jgi:UDP-glucose 4-epimerase
MKSSMAKSVLVTGGAGFIGSHVVDLFSSEGWTVAVLDDFSSGKEENVRSGVAVHRLNVRGRDAAALLRDAPVDVVVHLAAQMDVRRSVADPIFDAGTNILGTLNIAEAIRASGRRTRLIFASTGGALYGDFVTPPNVETFSKDPESPYAISKLSTEFYLAYYGRVHGMDVVSLRFSNVYGPRQDPHGEAGVVAIFCGRILENKSLTIFGDGSQTRDYVYVKDVAQAAYLAATSDLPKQEGLDSRAFNIGTGIGTSVNELAETLLRAAKRKVAMEYAPHRPGEQQHSFVDVAKAAKALGWKPVISLGNGLAETFAWFEAQRRASAATRAGKAV